MREWKLGLRLLVVAAHPDDESYLVSGTLYNNSLAGGKNFLICATLGAKGTSKLRKPMSAAGLKALRKRELLSASRFLGIKDCQMLDYPDGAVKECKLDYLEIAQDLAARDQPEAIVGFGPDGISGHLDHQAAHFVAKHLAQKLHLPFYMITVPPKLRRDFYGWVKQRRVAPHYDPKKLTYPLATHRVKVDPKIKLKALSYHKSQLNPKHPYHGYPDWASQELLKAEYFVKTNP